MTDKPEPEAAFWQMRNDLNHAAALTASLGVDRKDIANALLVSACDNYGDANGLEFVANWLRIAADVFKKNYPLLQPETVKH